MESYIKKSDIVAEIERRFLEDYNTDDVEMDEVAQGVLASLKYFLNTLEVKEEILDKEGKTKLMKKCVHKAYKRGYDMGVLQTTNKMNHNAKKVDLEKEIKEQSDKYYSQCEKKLQEMGDDDNDLSFLSLDNYAKYFFELGLKAQKGE